MRGPLSVEMEVMVMVMAPSGLGPVSGFCHGLTDELTRSEKRHSRANTRNHLLHAGLI